MHVEQVFFVYTYDVATIFFSYPVIQTTYLYDYQYSRTVERNEKFDLYID